MRTTNELKKSTLMVAAALLTGTLSSMAWADEPGRMTGGGSVSCLNGKVTYGFELHCGTGSTPQIPEGAFPPEPNNLQINSPIGQFHLLTLDSGNCPFTSSPLSEQPATTFDTFNGEGTGRFKYKGEADFTAGFNITFTLADLGEPGAGVDTAFFSITDASGNLVLECRGREALLLEGGNNQAHPATGSKQ